MTYIHTYTYTNYIIIYNRVLKKVVAPNTRLPSPRLSVGSFGSRDIIVLECVLEVLECWALLWLMVPCAEHDVVESIRALVRLGHSVAIFNLLQDIPVCV